MKNGLLSEPLADLSKCLKANVDTVSDGQNQQFWEEAAGKSAVWTCLAGLGKSSFLFYFDTGKVVCMKDASALPL